MAAPTTLRNEYNVKYELYFTDNYDRPLKLEILQKNYDGDIYNIIGTDNPIQIIYQGNDDMYSPLIGSRCKLNFYVTDSAQYDDFFKGDEREYKVKVLYYTSSGDLYEDLEMKPDFLETNFDINSNERSDEWRIEQFNRNRAIEDQVSTIEEMENKVDEIFNS